MAKKRETVADKKAGIFVNVKTVLEELTAATDRGTMIVGGSMLDEILALYIQSRLVDNPKVINDLIRESGPIGTFSARINLAYGMGLLTEDQFADLHTIREMRNAAAHSSIPIGFDVDSIRDKAMCLRLFLRIPPISPLPGKLLNKAAAPLVAKSAFMLTCSITWYAISLLVRSSSHTTVSIIDTWDDTYAQELLARIAASMS
jgi:DNA-binding MltR family transcriptional regulator